MGTMREIVRNWKTVFGDWKYLLLSVIAAFLFLALNVFISNIDSLKSFYSSLGFFGSLKFLISLIIGFGETVSLHSYVSLILISALFGILFSLIMYKSVVVKESSSKKVGFFASIGVFLGILAPGCAACGVGLISLFGLSAAILTLLPFDGIEISILSIGILGFVILNFSKNLTTCKIIRKKKLK